MTYMVEGGEVVLESPDIQWIMSDRPYKQGIFLEVESFENLRDADLNKTNERDAFSRAKRDWGDKWCSILAYKIDVYYTAMLLGFVVVYCCECRCFCCEHNSTLLFPFFVWPPLEPNQHPTPHCPTSWIFQPDQQAQIQINSAGLSLIGTCHHLIRD